MSLREYRRKRDFAISPEPDSAGSKGKAGEARFVIQKHEATRLHFDLRFEIGGVLVSWAVPKGLPMKHGEKRLAVKVEDHPVSYIDFEGTIPKGQYGGGTVMVWDTGTWTAEVKSPARELEGGKLHFTLKGEKLSGEWYLVQLKGGEEWLVIRGGEDHPALPKKAADLSVKTGRAMKAITSGEPEKSIPTSKPVKTAAKKSSKVSSTPSPVAQLNLDEVDFLEPMKARLEATAPEDDGWGYELKFDGFRAVAWKRGPRVALVSRTKHSLTEKFPDIAGAVSKLKMKDGILDGEIVALDPEGRSSFQLLQAYELGQEKPPLYFYVFDLLEHGGKSLVSHPLKKRKAALRKVVPENGSLVRYSAILGEDAAPLLDMAREHGLEGLIGKKMDSPYEAGRRSGAWIKLKLLQAQELVIGGYTEPTGTRAHLGAVLVGYYQSGKFCYAGKVGTGFNSANLADLMEKLEPLSTPDCPFPDLPEARTGRYGQGITAAIMKRCHWVKPTLVAQVKFAEWTRDGRLRQPVYLGLRPDKKASSVVREPHHSHGH